MTNLMDNDICMRSRPTLALHTRICFVQSDTNFNGIHILSANLLPLIKFWPQHSILMWPLPYSTDHSYLLYTIFSVDHIWVFDTVVFLDTLVKSPLWSIEYSNMVYFGFQLDEYHSLVLRGPICLEGCFMFRILLQSKLWLLQSTF